MTVRQMQHYLRDHPTVTGVIFAILAAALLGGAINAVNRNPPPGPVPSWTPTSAPTQVDRQPTSTSLPPRDFPPSVSDVDTSRNTIIICLGQEPDTLYTLTSNSSASVMVGEAFGSRGWDYDTAYFYYTQMLENNEFPSFENGGAEIKDDVLSVIFRFKDGITWSDGVPFTVDDILFTHDVLFGPDGIEAGDGIYNTMAFEKIDDLTLKITYEKGIKNPTYFLPPLASQNDLADILPQHTLKNLRPEDIPNSDYARTPNPVLGPYGVAEWVQGDHIRLRAVDNWWGGEVKTPNLIFRFIPDSNQMLAALLSGECDLAADALSAYEVPFVQQSASRGLLQYAATPSTIWEHFDFNTWPVDGNQQLTTPFFADPRVRQAVAYGTNRNQMAEEILFGEAEPLNSYLPSDHWAYNPELNGLYTFDPDRARSLLAEAGWEDRDGDGTLEAQRTLSGNYSCGRGSWLIPAGTPFKITLAIPTMPTFRDQLAAMFQDNMQDIGIDVALNQFPSASAMFADSAPLYTRNYDLAEFAWVANPDPDQSALYIGENIYTWDDALLPDLQPGPSGPYLVASKILEQKPGILAGTGITETMFKFGRPMDPDSEIQPDPSKLQFSSNHLPAGLTLQFPEQTPETKDSQDGSSETGWCNEEASQALFDAQNVLTQEARIHFTQQAQQFFMDDLPVLPLFPRLKVAAWATNLCGPQPGPENNITWNVETWYFSKSGECK